MRKGIDLVRVSSKEQSEGFSLDAQSKLLREYALKNDIRVVKEFRISETASKPAQRKLFSEMMDYLKENLDVKNILVEKVDRLTRNNRDADVIDSWFNEDAEREVHFVKQNLVISKTAKSHEKFQWDIYLAVAKQYINNLSEETRKGMIERFEQGYWNGLAPLGYINKKVGDKMVAIPDPERFDLIKEAFALYLTGSYCALEITEILYKKGLKSRNGKQLCNSIMINILSNPFYAGFMRWGGREKMGTHKPMISMEQHRSALMIMKAHNHNTSRRRIHDFLLRGFVFCGVCNSQRYTAEKHRTGKNPDYYHCSRSTVKHSNKNQNIEVGVLEKKVEEKFRDIQFTDETINYTVQCVKELYDQRKDERSRIKRGLQNQLIRIEENREKAENKLISGILTDNDYLRMRERFRAEASTIQEQIDEIEQKRDIDFDTARETLSLTRDVYEAYKNASPMGKRFYLSLFWDAFWVKDKKIIKSKPTQIIEAMIKDNKIIIKNPSFKGASNILLLRSASELITKQAISSVSEPNNLLIQPSQEKIILTSTWLRR